MEPNSRKEDIKKRMLELSEIGLYIDNYDFIFSDFDPRPFKERDVSEDFMEAAARLFRKNKTRKVDLSLLISSDKRKADDEAVIKERLKEYFSLCNKKIQSEMKDISKKGFIFIALGVFFMLAATYSLSIPQDSFLKKFIIIIFEPSGWFFFWEGLNKLLLEASRMKPNADFYAGMADCNIYFISY